MYQDNPQLELAFNFLMNTGRNLFLTGKAGTGKTTFLRNLRNKTFKRTVVVAPTGVAAINAGGVTIHSFFQVAFGPQIPSHYLPESQKMVENQFRFSREKLNIIRSLDLLVIDEISMVRADLLDAIDGVLRQFKNKSLPFGGVQVLMIGDLQQLAPVVKESDWDVLKPYYSGPFFFQSKVLQQFPAETIELKHIYRQSDSRFIDVLNEIRENRISQQTIDILNSRHVPNFNQAEGYITLCSHNRQAQYINEQKLQSIPLKPKQFHAAVEGDFPEYSYPNDKELVLKPGAQVMFVKNDTSREKLYYNGKIGRVSRISDESVFVECEDSEDPIEVSRVEWQNYKYSLNERTNEIEETVIGKFSQIPLKTAWAITIHKSQGLTFEKAIIDANMSFAHGQVYVALSRCKTLEGLILSSPIDARSVITSHEVDSFIKQSESNPPTVQRLKAFQIEYEWQLVSEMFNFNALWRRMAFLEKEMKEHQNVIFGTMPIVLKDVMDRMKPQILDVAQKFDIQLRHLFAQGIEVAENPHLTERITKGATYFYDNLTKLMVPFLDSEAETDNMAIRKIIDNQMQYIQALCGTHFDTLKACRESFSIATYLHSRSVSFIEKTQQKKKQGSTTTTTTQHPQLYRLLRQWRDDRAEELNTAVYAVIQTKTMVDLCNALPSTIKHISKIKGMGKVRTDRWGKEILTIIKEYCSDKGIVTPELDLTSEEPEEKAQKKAKGANVMNSLGLYKLGFSIAEIADKTGFVVSTIETHLAKAIEQGDLEIEKLMPTDKINEIKLWLMNNKSANLSEAKQALDFASYGEIRMVQAALKHES